MQVYVICLTVFLKSSAFLVFVLNIAKNNSKKNKLEFKLKGKSYDITMIFSSFKNLFYTGVKTFLDIFKVSL